MGVGLRAGHAHHRAPTHLQPRWARGPAPLPISPLPRPHRDIGPKEVVVTQQATHVLHAAFFLHAVPDIGFEEGTELAQGERNTITWLSLRAGPCSSSS